MEQILRLSVSGSQDPFNELFSVMKSILYAYNVSEELYDWFSLRCQDCFNQIDLNWVVFFNKSKEKWIIN